MRLSLLSAALFLFYGAFAQIDSPEKTLSAIGRKILEHPEFEKRDSANTAFLNILQKYIATEKGYNDPLTSVSNMLRLAEEDVHVYTWQMPDSTFHYVKYGLVAAKTRKGIVVTELKDEAASISEANFKILKPENWYGAIYYEMIPIEKGRSDLYTLLGFSPDREVNEKIIDVMEISRKGIPKFGARIFKVDEFMDRTFHKAPMRLILSYGGKYAASVRWNEEEEMIIMDHLSPPDARLKGVYRMYGPDMSYDGLVWKDDWWNLKKEVKFNSGQHIEIVPPDKETDLPPGRPSRGIPPAGE